MKKPLAALLSAIALLLPACYEAEDEFTLNPDGSGKVSFVRIVKIGGPMGGPAGDDPAGMLKQMAAEMLQKWEGVEAWKGVAVAMQEDGRGRISGTAYFPDIRKFRIPGEFDAIRTYDLTRSADQELRIVLVHDEAAPSAPRSEEEVRKAVLARRAEYQAQKPMMQMLLKDLKVARRFRVPGKIAAVRALRKESDSVAGYSLDGAKLLQAMDQALMDDTFMSVSVHVASGQESEMAIPPGLKERMFGEPGPASIEVAGELKNLFDYKPEVRTAISAEKMLASLEPARPEVVVPVQVNDAPAPAKAPAPAPPTTQPGAVEALPAGDVKVAASAQVAFSGGSRGGLNYTLPIEVELTFTGGAAASAYRFGKITLASALDEIGQSMEPVSLDQDFTILDRAKLGVSSKRPKHPADGFRTNVSFMRPDEHAIPRSIAIAGTITVQTPRKMTVDAIGTLPAGRGQVALEDPALDALGSFTLGRQGGQVNVTVEGRKSTLEAVDVILRDAAGKPLRSDGIVSSGPDDRYRVQHDFLAGATDLATIRLEVLLPQETMVVPFDIKDLQVPSSPDMQRNVGEPLPAPPDLQLSGVEVRSRDAGTGRMPDKADYLYLDGTIALTRRVESVERLRVISARAQDGSNPRIKRRSSEDPGHIWSLDESGQKVSFSVPVKRPAAAGGVIRDVAGEVVVNVGEGTETVDLGFSDLLPGAVGKKLGARIEGLSRDQEAGGAERVEIHLQTPPNTIRVSRSALRDEEPAVRILDETGAEVQPARRLLGSFGEGNKGSVISVWIPRGVPRGARVLVECLRGVTQYRLPFTAAKIDGPAGTAPDAVAASPLPGPPRAEAARIPAAPAPSNAPSQPEARMPPQAGTVAIAASARLSGKPGADGGWETSTPIEVRLVFTGGAAASADRFGRIQVAAHADGTGGPPLEMKKFPIGSKLPSGFESIDRSEVDLLSKERIHPDNGFSLTLNFSRPGQGAPRIARLAGTVALLSMGRTVIDDIGSRLAGRAEVALRDPRLDALGSFSISREDDTLYVHLDVLQEKFESGTVELLDADGKTFAVSGASGSLRGGGQRQTTYTYSVGGRSLAGARLEVFAPSSTVVVPFELKEVPIDTPPKMRDALAKEKASPPPPAAKSSSATASNLSPAARREEIRAPAPLANAALIRWGSQQGNEVGSALVRSPDGKVVVAGTLRARPAGGGPDVTDVLLVRFLADGSLDPGFGSGGVVSWSGGGRRASDIAAALCPDRKILVAMSLRVGEKAQEKSEIVVIRFNADGSLDAGFGTGGVVRWAGNQDLNTCSGIAIQSDSKAVVAGGVRSTVNGKVVLAPVLLRLGTDGSLDPTFKNGVAARDKARDLETIKDLAVQRDGKILLAGYAYSDSNPRHYDALLTRFNADGSLDAGFGEGGSVTWDHDGRNDMAYALALEADGMILVAGSSGRERASRIFILKYNADGSRGSGFSAGGALIWESGREADFCKNLGVLSDGKIVVSGAGRDSTASNATPLVARFTAAGILDAGFGTGGVVSWFGGALAGESQFVNGMILDPDGNILLTGSIGSGMNVTDLFLMKFEERQEK